jgi:hypothetical protein
VCVITFDLPGMEHPVSSYVTAITARRNDDDEFICAEGLAATGDWRKLHDEDLHDIKPNLILFGYRITGAASGT